MLSIHFGFARGHAVDASQQAVIELKSSLRVNWLLIDVLTSDGL